MSVDDNKLDIGYVPDDPDFGQDERVQKKPVEKKVDQKKKAQVRKSTAKLKVQEKVIEKLTVERDEFKDKFLRNMAEIDNFRKRVKKEKEEHQKYALGDFLKELLVITDNLERALKVKDDESTENSIISGVEMIYRQLMEILNKNGVIEIEAMNKPFDPNIHQALSKEEADFVSGPTITEVYQKGFTYNDKLLRPTLAKVAIPPEPVNETDTQE
ncbi:MAG: nucleotide exchange factor GrpE [Candidatus Aminicenantes bacterium]|nr:nucleotide exchange factor GrpE [Candidatus Aminicenantes bacterium]